MMSLIQFTHIDIPDFGLPTVQPSLTTETYVQRIANARERAKALNLDVLVVYGDREHFSNIEYLTGYDPRFEEALLIIDRVTQQPMLIVGNEGWDYADKIPYRIRKRRYTSFSLPNQPYNELPTLQLLFSEAGIERGSKVALFGWKLFARNEQERVRMHDMPYTPYFRKNDEMIREWCVDNL